MNKPVLPMSSLSLKLPTANRSIETYRLAASRVFPARLEGTLNRVAFSAAKNGSQVTLSGGISGTLTVDGTGRLTRAELPGGITAVLSD